MYFIKTVIDIVIFLWYCSGYLLVIYHLFFCKLVTFLPVNLSLNYYYDQAYY